MAERAAQMSTSSAEQDRIQRHEDLNSPEAIRARINSTRANIEATLTAIGTKLSPTRLKERALELVKGKMGDMKPTARQTKDWSMQTTKMMTKHPIPVGLVGIGVVWLIKDRLRQRANANKDEYLAQKQALAAALESYAGTIPHRGEEPADHVQDRSEDLASTAATCAEDVRIRAQAKTKNLAGGSSPHAQRQKDRFPTLLQGHPLALCLVSLAIGAAVGLLLPGTRKEDELVGATRDRVVEQVKEHAVETVEDMKERSEEALLRAQEAAEADLFNKGT